MIFVCLGILFDFFVITDGFKVLIHHIHYSFPKNVSLAAQWRTILRMNGNQIHENVHSVKACQGRICIEHFTDDDFVKKKSAYVQLKPTAMPSIFNVFNHLNPEEINNAYKKQANGNLCNHYNECEICKECFVEKNDRIKILKTNHVANMQRIQYLEKKLNETKMKYKKSRDKYHFLNGTKTKLRAVIEELRKKNDIDDELRAKLMVCNR